MRLDVYVETASETRRLGRSMAQALRAGDVLLIEGDLGAGKTTLVQGLAEGLGVDVPVTSPTFTLMRVLETDGRRGIDRLLHADLYRLDDLNEVVDLGLLDLVDDRALAAVEWGSAGSPVLDEGALEIEIEIETETETGTGGAGGASEGARHVTITGDRAWADRAGQLAESVGASLGGPPDGSLGASLDDRATGARPCS